MLLRSCKLNAQKCGGGGDTFKPNISLHHYPCSLTWNSPRIVQQRGPQSPQSQNCTSADANIEGLLSKTTRTKLMARPLKLRLPTKKNQVASSTATEPPQTLRHPPESSPKPQLLGDISNLLTSKPSMSNPGFRGSSCKDLPFSPCSLSCLLSGKESLEGKNLAHLCVSAWLPGCRAARGTLGGQWPEKKAFLLLALCNAMRRQSQCRSFPHFHSLAPKWCLFSSLFNFDEVAVHVKRQSPRCQLAPLLQTSPIKKKIIENWVKPPFKEK